MGRTIDKTRTGNPGKRFMLASPPANKLQHVASDRAAKYTTTLDLAGSVHGQHLGPDLDVHKGGDGGADE